MATVGEWIEGARPRTLPAALAPVLAGSATAWYEGGFRLGCALLAFLVALALQIGVNFANDYSDGIRGTDEDRVGPMRLVGSGAATPAAVKAAAFGCFALGALAGLVLVALTGHWWLVLVGAACILAAWFYTGGEHPYGYAGLGEVFVFVFFGLVAVCGTTYVQLGRMTWATLAASVAIGILACQILVANNLRDIVGDREVGKRTLATRLGDAGTRRFFALLSVLTVACCVAVAVLTTWWALLSLLMLVFLVPATRTVLSGATGKALIAVLKQTGFAELACSLGLFLGCVLRWIGIV
ncbi:MAG: 1,4-dihydroxy-2-naphthoate polyprenyltransferase [Luteococcus sp.]|uniref:1,4-dihydroxy-2-naphthoate polyprenyltransferase n=1 Tax=Luteococcus sp. TaxID=1969402 RepID=UPI00264744AB|nr:1,4-dihydroxy-2-naphthoate polyprenyltransferase [Luteococcus sp.]MDN5562173.1 1,4-dihydroxy-2-naphthoate polyprenyltransferase [Luteococcus sp.]